MERLRSDAQLSRPYISSSPTTVLGLDYGTRRIGLAVGDSGVGIAHPLERVEVRSDAQRWERLQRAASEWKPGLWVVGLPVREDGGEHELAPAVRAFAGELQRRFGIPVHLIDERFTSAEAAQRLRESGVHGRAQKRHLDELAATGILQSYFDRNDANP